MKLATMRIVRLQIIFAFVFFAASGAAQDAWTAISETDKMTDAKSIGFLTQAKVPTTNNEVSLAVSCEDAKGKSGLLIYVSAEHSVIDTSVEYLSKWRFDSGTAGIVHGWHRTQDGSLIYMKGNDAFKFANMLAVTNTLRAQLPMYSVGIGDGYPVMEFAVSGLGPKLDGHCGFQKPALTEEQSKALGMNTLSANSLAGQTSPAAAAAMAHDGHVSTPQEMSEEIKAGRASKCAVITDPPGAEVFIDGNKGGITPLVFVLIKRAAPRNITVKLAGYKTVERAIEPSGLDIPVALKLEKTNNQ